MDLEKLKARLKRAYVNHSLRKIASWTDVSFETLRKIILSANGTSLTINTFNKIDQGLKKNGF